MSWGTVCTKVVFSEILIGHYVSRSHERILRDLLLHWHPLLCRTTTASVNVGIWQKRGVLKHAFYICRLLLDTFQREWDDFDTVTWKSIWHHVFQSDFFLRKSSSSKSIRCKSAPNRISSLFSVWNLLQNCFKFNYLPIFTGKETSFFPHRRCHFVMSVFSSVSNCIEIKIQKMMKKPSFYAFDKNYVTFH